MMFLIVLAALAATSSGQIISSGRCDLNVSVVGNFSVERYTGLWYEMFRYEHVNQINADCVTARYTIDNGTVRVLNSMVVDGTAFAISGTVSVAPGANGGGKLVVNFPSTGNEFSDYWVLSTDYSNYALVYACTNLENNTKRISSWVISRKTTLSPQSVLAMNPALLATDGLFWDNYRQTLQTEAACKVNNLRY